MEIGFIGVGTINEAMVHAICKSSLSAHLHLSKRNVERSNRLKEIYGDRITIANTNQEVLDNSEYVFIAVLPKQIEEVYSELKFNNNHKVFNLTRFDRYDNLLKYTEGAKYVEYIIPLVFIKNIRGPVVMYPKNEEAKEFLDNIADVVEVDEWKDTVTLQDISGLEAAYFTLLDLFNKWCKKEGMNENVANKFISGLFMSMSKQANMETPKRVEELADEYTPGGLNYKVKKYLNENNGFDLWKEALDSL